MIREISSKKSRREEGKWQHHPQLKQQVSGLINKHTLGYGSYIRVNTSIPHFHPTFVISPSPTISQHREQQLKSTGSVTGLSQQITIQHDEYILNYGSQLFLQEVSILIRLQRQFFLSCEVVKPYFENCLFVEIIFRGKFVTFHQGEVVLREISTHEGFWTIETLQDKRVRIRSMNQNQYLFLTTDSVPFNCQSSKETYFIIQEHPERQFYLLYFQNKKKISLQVQLNPVDNSAISIYFQLSFAKYYFDLNPSLPFISSLLSELLFYSIPEFSENESLLSEHIQILLWKYELLQEMCDFVGEYLDECMEDEITDEVQNLFRVIRLMGLGNKNNVEVLAKLINKIIKMNTFFPLVGLLISGNPLFGPLFQTKGWYQILMKKLSLFQSLELFDQVEHVYELLTEFTKLSIPNKYLMLHTFEFEERQHLMKENFMWLRIYSEGMYVFLEVEGENNRLQEVQLSTFLGGDYAHPRQRELLMQQIKLMSSFCQGLILNALDFYNVLWKTLAPYIYKNNFPTISNLHFQKVILGALTTSYKYAPSQRSQLFQSHYNVGFINLDKQANRKPSLKGVLHKPVENKNRLAVYQQFRELFGWVERKVDSYNNGLKTIEEICSEGGVDNNTVLEELQLIGFCLGSRLVTVTQRKQAEFMEYMKKLFQNVNVKENKKKSGGRHERTISDVQGKVSESSIEVDENMKKEMELPINGIIDFLFHIINYSPVYESYLKAYKIERKQQNKFNRVLNNIIKINDSHLVAQNSNPGILRTDKNDYMNYIYKQMWENAEGVQFTTSQHFKYLHYLDELKTEAFNDLALIYQNINEEQLNDSVETLTYILKNPNHFSNKFLLEKGLTKYPKSDSFKQCLLEQWYISLSLSSFNACTTCLRYLYTQSEIYVRVVNNLQIVVGDEAHRSAKLVGIVMREVEILSRSIKNWFLPSLLSHYQANYKNLVGHLQGVSLQLRKTIITEEHELVDIQRILNNLGLLPICLSLLSHTTNYQNNQNSQMIEKIKPIHEEIIKILDYFMEGSTHHAKKVLLCLGCFITKSKSLLPLIRKIFSLESLEDCSRVAEYIRLMNDRMIENLVANLPTSRAFLQSVLFLDRMTFMRTIERISSENNLQILKRKDKFEELVLDFHFRELSHKITNRVFDCEQGGLTYLSWYYSFFMKAILQKECKQNTHFKAKIIKPLTREYIREHSYIAVNVYTLLSSKNMVKKFGGWMGSEEGRVVIIEYIMGEVLSSILSPPAEIVAEYLIYYFYDLLPLLVFVRDELKTQAEMKEKILDKIDQYAKAVEKGTLDMKTEHLKSRMDTQEQKMEQKLESTSQGRLDITLEDIDKAFSRDDFIRNVKKFIHHGEWKNFKPRILRAEPIPQTNRNAKSQNSLKKMQMDSSTKRNLQRKAVKKWYKARLLLNQKVWQNWQKGFEKWTSDLRKMQQGYEQSHFQKVINSSDILHKMYRSIMNLNRLELESQNEIFILRCSEYQLKALQGSLKKKRKSKGKHAEGRVREETQPVIVVKKLTVNQLTFQLMAQIHYKLTNQDNSVIALCFMLRVLKACIEINPLELYPQVMQELLKALRTCSALHVYHKQMMQLYEIEQSVEFYLAGWSPLEILLTILRDTDNIPIHSLKDIVEAMLTVKYQRPQLETVLQPALQQLSSVDYQTFDSVNQQLMSNEPFLLQP